MPRYIDADSFSERFDMMCDAGGVLAPITKAVREMVKRLIKTEPTVDVQSADVEPIKGWISVKKRLPEEDGKYMVWYRGEVDICEFDVESQTFGYSYCEDGEMYSLLVCWDDSMDKNVTHWMPLPEPPKGE